MSFLRAGMAATLIVAVFMLEFASASRTAQDRHALGAACLKLAPAVAPDFRTEDAPDRLDPPGSPWLLVSQPLPSLCQDAAAWVSQAAAPALPFHLAQKAVFFIRAP
jgi:hypothetical protein